MLLPATCPHCQHEFSIDSAFRGLNRICPSCNQKFLFDPVDAPPTAPQATVQHRENAPKQRFQKLTACCPQCDHEFKVEPAYLGVTRACPACSHKFIFDTPKEGIEAAESMRGGNRLCCPHCYQTFIPSGVFAEAAVLPCGLCEAQISSAEARQLETLMKSGGKRCSELLLQGLRNIDIIDELMTLGLSSNAAIELIARQVEKIPFERNEVARTGHIHQFSPAGNCDSCAKHLDRYEQSKLHRITWLTHEFTGKRELSAWSAVTLVAAGAIVTQNEIKKVYRDGLYFLCMDCMNDPIFRFPLDGNIEKIQVTDL